MDVREKLAELLDEAEEWADHKCDELDCETCYAGKMKGNCVQKLMVDRLIAHGVTVQEWISTNERIPTEDDATDEYVAVIYTLGDSVKIKTISLVDVVIAHPDLYDYWMPLNLPQPPKGE